MGKRRRKSSAGRQGDSDAPKKIVVGSGAPKIRPPKLTLDKRFYYIGSAIGILLILIVVLVLFLGRHRLPGNISSVCTDAIATKANAYHNIGDISSLTQLTYDIKTKSGYQNDPNCTYIIAEQQLLSGDVNSAESTIGSLEKTYGESYHFNGKLDNGKAGISNLREQLHLMKNVEENSRARFDPDI